MPDRKPVTVPRLVEMKARGQRIVVVTAYDYPMARCADRAGVDALLVGDTLGMVVLGYSSTLPVTMDEMLHHVRAVTRAQTKALVIADMPFLSYQAGMDDAVRNAGRLIKEGGAACVKLEGGTPVVPLVERLVSIGIPVMAHLGMTPQSMHLFGGFKVQARQADRARRLLEDALALEAAGAFSLVLEGIPSEVAREVTAALRIPTVGIGAGPHCDGEVQVLHDLLGLFDLFLAKHTKRYAEIGKEIESALASYAEEVRSRRFPGEANTFHQRDLEDPDAWK
jgi:3-methyl-2-oxobutanoate hydroxymethyltransferase